MRRFLVVLVALGAALAWSNAASASTTLGHAGGDQQCGADGLYIEDGSSPSATYTVPAGQWRVTSWSYSNQSLASGEVALFVVRPLGGSNYEVVGQSSVEPMVAGPITGTWSTSITGVQGGDLIGLWVKSTGGIGALECVSNTGLPGDDSAWYVSASPPANGTTYSPSSNFGDLLPNVLANLDPASSGLTRAPDHVFLCYSKWEQDGGMVVAASLATSLVAQGMWWPVALPGDVAGGDNLGAYHLVCNPPATDVSTGQSVSDGGDVVDGSPSDYYAIE